MNPQLMAMIAALAGSAQAMPQEDPLQLMAAQFQQQAAQMEDGPDPNNAFEGEITPGSLGDAVKDSWENMAHHRDIRTAGLEKYAGPRYLTESGNDPQYVNLVQNTVETLIPQLVSFEPKAHVQPVAGGLMIEAMIRELSLNRAAQNADLGELHFNWVLDALFAPYGVVRIGLKAGQEQVSVGSKVFNRGEFFGENIDFDDYVLDQSCRSYKERMFEGHRMRIPRSVALAAERSPGVPLYDQAAIRGAPRLTLGRTEASVADRINGHQGDPYDLVDMIELWEIAVFLGDKTMIYTLTSLTGGGWAREPYEFWGPETGPYRVMWFSPLPSNNMPVSYVSRVLDLHDAGVRATGRYIDSIDKTKTVNVYRSGEEDLADAVRSAKHEDWIQGDPTALASISNASLARELQPGMQFIMELFNNATSSSQLLGGQKDIANTATAATILQGNAQARLAVMIQRAMRGLTQIFRAMAWYQDNDPMLRETLVARLPGGVRTELQNTPELRQGDHNSFIYSVASYAAKPMDPAVKLDKLVQAIGVLISVAPLGMQAFSKVAQVMAKELQIPEIDEINPDQTMAMARQAVAQAEGPSPKDDPMKRPGDVRPRPYQQTLAQFSGSTRRGNGPASGAF